MGQATEPSEIAGRYQISEKLGEGAFGRVCRARDTVLGRMVAIKTVRLEGLAAAGTQLDELMDRFRREAQVAAQLKHPNIVTIYDIGEDDGLNYIAMEYIEGRGLDELIRESGRLPMERVVAIGVQVAEALDYAHRHSVVHRDIKPANVMLEAEDHVKVTDFGIAKPLDAGEALTATGSLLGTPAYMSPEQARGETLDGRSDLFSLGCLLYEMALGARAFQGESLTSLLLKIVSEQPRPPREVDPSLPEPFSAIVSRALSKDPKERHQSGKELAKDLSRLGSATTISDLETLQVSRDDGGQATLASAPTLPAPAAPSPAAASPAPAPTAAAAPPEVATPRRGPIPGLIGAVGVLVLVVGFLAWRLLSTPDAPAPEVSSGALTSAPEVVSEAPGVPEAPDPPEQRASLETLARLATRDDAAAERSQPPLDEAQHALEGLSGLLGQVEEMTGDLSEEEEDVDPTAFLQQVLGGGSQGAARNGVAARTGLAVLVQAQEAFRATTGRYGKPEELAATLRAMGGDLGDLRVRGDHVEVAGIRYTVRLTDAGFVAEATPVGSASPLFVTDQTGVIREAPDRD